ncbi:MAG: 30S ribosomal protein S17e [Candidatus Aenigmatarchaeota archaeon]
MGRIRSKWVKNLARNLVEQYPDKFSTKFEDNKKALNELKIVDDKSTRNKIAGYVISVVEKKKIK